MNKFIAVFLTFLSLVGINTPLVSGQSVGAKTLHLSETVDPALTNDDILTFVKLKLAPEVVIAKIRASKCAFAVSAEDLEALRSAGVPQDVLEAMTEASNSSAKTQNTDSPPSKQSGPLQIPDGTPIEIEAPYTFTSLDFKPKDEISFHVVNPVKINGVTVIEQGATATGRIEQSKRGGHFGKAGLFVWSMQTVTAIDGSQVPLKNVQVRLRGDSKGATVATQMIITGALLPLIAPVALLYGFKRGKDAFIPAGKRYDVFVNGQAVVKVN
jgi:hypothetical protein